MLVRLLFSLRRAHRSHIGGGVPVVYLLRVLGNNWSLVEIVVDEMGRGTNDLYAPLIGLPVGAVPHKRGQKRMVNVHDPVVVVGHKVGSEHAHTFSQNKVIGLVDGKGAQHGGFMFFARFPSCEI